jgi:hypothetical protein
MIRQAASLSKQSCKPAESVESQFEKRLHRDQKHARRACGMMEPATADELAVNVLTASATAGSHKQLRAAASLSTMHDDMMTQTVAWRTWHR